MDYEHFSSVITNLYQYYQRKLPGHQAMATWFPKLQHIPTEAAAWIVDWIERQYESIPRNLPLSFNNGWSIYQKEHPEKFTSRYTHTPCQSCGGAGFNLVMKNDSEKGYDYSHIRLCNDCENYRQIFSQRF
jgi:hypothetical protein